MLQVNVFKNSPDCKRLSGLLYEKLDQMNKMLAVLPEFGICESQSHLDILNNMTTAIILTSYSIGNMCSPVHKRGMSFKMLLGTC